MNLHGPVRAAKTAGSGTAELTISFDAWTEGRVAPTHHKASVIAPKSFGKSEPVSPRLVRKLVHPHRKVGIRTLRFSGDGAKLFAAGYPSGVVQLWDAKTWKELCRIETPPGLRSTGDYAILSPDWRRLYVPILGRKVVREKKDGKRVAWSEYNGSVRIWDLTTGKEQPPISTPGRGAHQVILSPDGKTMITPMGRNGSAAKPDRRVTEIWDLPTRASRKLCDGYGLSVFAPDGQSIAVLTSSSITESSTLRMFNAPGTKELARFEYKSEDGRLFSGPMFTPDGRAILVRLGGKRGAAPTVWLFDAKTLTKSGELVGEPIPEEYGWMFVTGFSPDGKRLVAIDGPGRVGMYDLATRKLVRAWSVGDNVRPSHTLFSPDGRRLYVNAMLNLSRADIGEDTDPADMPQTRVYVFDLDSKSDQPAEVIYAPPGYLGNMALSPDGRTLALGTAGGVLLFDVANLSKP